MMKKKHLYRKLTILSTFTDAAEGEGRAEKQVRRIEVRGRQRGEIDR